MLHYSKLFSEYHTLTLENGIQIMSHKPSPTGLSHICLLVMLKMKHRLLKVVCVTLNSAPLIVQPHFPSDPRSVRSDPCLEQHTVYLLLSFSVFLIVLLITWNCIIF